MNVANLIALFRIIVLPLIIYLVYQETATSYIWATVLFIVALISDFLDGYIARKRDQVTKVGSFLDLLADKILIVGLLLVFAIRGSFSVLILLFFILRDVIVVILRWLASNEDIQVLRKWPSRFTIFSQQGIILGLLVSGFLSYKGLAYDVWLITVEIFIFLVTILALVFAIVSIVYYSHAYWRGVHTREKLGKKVKKESMVILANKKARGYHDKYRRHLLNVFARRRKVPIFFLPNNKRNMFVGIENKIKKFQHVIIAGGDGSFEGALNYKPLQQKQLGFFPLGAGNAFYSYFYKGKRFEYLRSHFHFRETNLDVLEVEWEKGKVQTTTLSLGIDAEVVRLGEERTMHGFFDYLKASWKALFRARADYDFECTIDKKCYQLDNCANLTLAKVPYYGYSLRSILGKVEPNDGMVYGLAVINTHLVFLNKLARFWALVLASLNLERNPLLRLKGKRFVIKSEVPFPIQAGGEFLGYTQWVKVRVKRKQKVLMI